MKRIFAFLLVVVMVMSFAACGGKKTDSNTTVPETTVPETTGPDASTDEVSVTYFSIYYSETPDSYQVLSAFPDESGVTISYQAEIRKEGTVDASAMATIYDAYKNSGLPALVGMQEYVEGPSASFSVSYSDGTMEEGYLYGELPEEFFNGLAAMKTCFETVTAELPEYVAQPVINGELADSDKVSLDAILAEMELPYIDNYAITGLVKDDTFAVMAGLSSADGIATGLTFSPMMITTPYSLVLVTLEEGADANAIVANFEQNLDFAKWICVSASDALIATKDNQVICVMGSDQLFSLTNDAITAAGWNVVKNIHNDAYMN